MGEEQPILLPRASRALNVGTPRMTRSTWVQFQLAGWWINTGPNLLGQVMLLTDGVFLDQMEYQELETS